MDSETLSIVIGLGLLVVGMFFVLNIGTLLWVKSALGRKSGETGEREPASTAQKIKSWVGAIAAIVGLMTTMGGAMNSCDSGPTAPTVIGAPPPSYDYGSRCCTPYGVCQMMQVGEVGQGCTCFDQMGNFASGNVCR